MTNEAGIITYPKHTGLKPDPQHRHNQMEAKSRRQKHSLKVRTAGSKQQSPHHPSPRPNRKGKEKEVTDE